MNDPGQSSTTRGLPRTLIGLARCVLHSKTVVPNPVSRRALRAVHGAIFVSREGYEWVRRSLFATPMFLAQCEAHGDRISIDRVPYMTGWCRIRLGSNVRISGRIDIMPSSRDAPLLQIGSNVFIGHGCTFALAERIEIGDFTSIGGGTYIADTSGHSHRRLNVPVWDDLAGPEDIAPVIIEDNVHVGRNCTILKGVRIGARSVVGANSVVRRDVAPDTFVAGNPARPVGWKPGAAASSVSPSRCD